MVRVGIWDLGLGGDGNQCVLEKVKPVIRYDLSRFSCTEID